MADSIELSQEQADLLAVSIDPAIKSLLETGNYWPSIYMTDGRSVKYYTIGMMKSLDELRELAKAVIRSQDDSVVAYAFLYDSSVETEDGPADILVIETGDAEDDQAMELAKWYDRNKESVGESFFRLGMTNNLLREI